MPLPLRRALFDKGGAIPDAFPRVGFQFRKDIAPKEATALERNIVEMAGKGETLINWRTFKILCDGGRLEPVWPEMDEWIKHTERVYRDLEAAGRVDLEPTEEEVRSYALEYVREGHCLLSLPDPFNEKDVFELLKREADARAIMDRETIIRAIETACQCSETVAERSLRRLEEGGVLRLYDVRHKETDHADLPPRESGPFCGLAPTIGSEVRPVAQKRKKQGRPADRDEAVDARLSRDWKASRLRKEQFAREKGMPLRELMLALERHRKRKERS